MKQFFFDKQTFFILPQHNKIKSVNFSYFYIDNLAIFTKKYSINIFYFRDLLDEARVFHLIPERRPLLQSFRTKQRACEVRGHIYVVGGLNRHGIYLN